MNNIKEIAQDAALSQIARQKVAETLSAAAGETKSGPPIAGQGQDLIQVDQSRRDEAILEENARILLAELPDVRPDRIALARRNLEAGVYNQPDVLASTAEKLQADLATKAALPDPEKQVESARRRVAQGYYEQPDVLDETARRIADRHR